MKYKMNGNLIYHKSSADTYEIMVYFVLFF
jgi:hypothetical protein